MGIEKAAMTAAEKVFLRANEALGMKGFPPHMRTRNLDQALRRANGTKLLKTIRDEFNLSKEALASHSDRMKLGTLKKLRGIDSEKDLLHGKFGLKGGRDTKLDGSIRGKRSDTHLGTVEKKYGEISDHRSDMHLGTLEKKRGIKTQNELLDGKFGLRGGRDVNANGQIRSKRGDTHVGTIEKQYHVDFDVRSDMHLKTLLKKEKAETLSQAVKKVRSR